jgi:hypothetical protein
MFGSIPPWPLYACAKPAKEAPRVSDVILEAWASGLIEIAKFRSTPKALDANDQNLL